MRVRPATPRLRPYHPGYRTSVPPNPPARGSSVARRLALAGFALGVSPPSPCGALCAPPGQGGRQRLPTAPSGPFPPLTSSLHLFRIYICRGVGVSLSLVGMVWVNLHGGLSECVPGTRQTLLTLGRAAVMSARKNKSSMKRWTCSRKEPRGSSREGAAWIVSRFESFVTTPKPRG